MELVTVFSAAESTMPDFIWKGWPIFVLVATAYYNPNVTVYP